MLKFLVKALGLIAGLALSGAVCAMGMGGINVTTALGEPLNAAIELVAIGKAEKDKLSARLASPDAFRGAGMEYPSGLPALKFQIEAHADGAPYLKVTSTQPVNEPFISLLVELNWPSGRLLREYTFLLDPPSYKSEQPKVAEVKPVLSKTEEPAEPAAAGRPYQQEWAEAAKSEPAPMRAKVPVDEKALAEAAAPAKKSAEGGNVAAGSIKVKRGDTLSQIARETKPSDVSLERMLVALYRANINTFDGRNMNRLSTGKILRVPEQSELGGLAQDDAIKEIRTQVADWNAYRQKLAAVSVHTAGQTPKQTASGKISTTVAEKAPVAKETAKEVVRLSKGEAPGDKAAAGGSTKNLQDKIHALEEEATAKSKALKEGNERVAMLEKNIKEMQRLIELKGLAVAPKPEAKSEPVKIAPKPPAPLPAVPVAAPGTPTKPAAVAQDAASAVKPAKPARPAMEPKVVPPPPSLLDEPLYLAGGAAALLALGGLGFVAARRRKTGKPDKKTKVPDGNKGEKDTGSIGAHISEPVIPSPETGDFTHGSTASGSAQPEDVDPISEAELFLNFGRDAQAEEILKEALDKNPANNQIRLKLLSIYAKRKDSKTFSAIARQIQDSGDEPAWAQATEMGRGLEPNNPMYGSTGDETITAVAAEEQGEAEQQAVASLDFDLGLAPEAAAATNDENTELGAPLDQKDTAMPAMDFDLGIGEPAAAAPENESTMILSAPLDQTAATPLAMDFDLGIGEPEETATPVDEGATTLSAPQVEQTPPEELQTAHEAPMDFDITTKHPSVAAAEPEQVAATITPNLDDLVFDITSSHPSPDAAKEEQAATDAPENADNAMEFTLDFPVEEKPDTAAAQAAPKETVDIDLSGINFDLGESTAAAPASDVKDAHWHDVATKLDLAKAYQEMGDNAGAREILDEVLAEGDEQQRATAEAMKQQLLA